VVYWGVVFGKRRVGAIMHGRGQGATLSCGMRTGWASAKTELDQALVAGRGMLANSDDFLRFLMISFTAR
jgi:hypothetical protein